MKTIHVVAAVIRDGGRILATQRGYGPFRDGWEFPGGKVEEGETEREALVREIREELRAEIAVDEKIGQVEHDYPAFHLSMGCYFCHLTEGTPELTEHEAARWLTRDTIGDVDWLPADLGILPKIAAALEAAGSGT